MLRIVFFFHGYSFSIELTFAGNTLDDRNWLMGFGDLKEVKEWIKNKMDHKTLVAHDDPQLEFIKTIAAQGLIQLEIVDHVGAEKFAEMIYNHVASWMKSKNYTNGVRLESVRLHEHPGNGAIYQP